MDENLFKLWLSVPLILWLIVVTRVFRRHSRLEEALVTIATVWLVVGGLIAIMTI
jgi:hypothetical protein